MHSACLNLSESLVSTKSFLDLRYVDNFYSCCKIRCKNLSGIRMRSMHITHPSCRDWISFTSKMDYNSFSQFCMLLSKKNQWSLFEVAEWLSMTKLSMLSNIKRWFWISKMKNMSILLRITALPSKKK